MMKETSILTVATITGQAIRETILKSCKLDVVPAKTSQFIPSVQICEDLGAFVSFSGNYNGLLVINFEGAAALEVVAANLRTMGIPESEIPTHFMADDVRNTIGELVNHIIGKARNIVQTKFDLVATATIPAVVPVTTPIGLVFRTNDSYPCVRIAFRTPGHHRFHMELAMEPTLFIAKGEPGQP